ncbi:MAG: bifunctional adenosylcobinamide kinase/adenosylcobinamide-phosphate guanylyltransferase [Armatimonadetes bacterium]|nr:bifunctional adenosylcobinamide kinase/adenosylcobinamide-phosphate guanylyltransferase [Armatimonadota bacterium]
MARIILITGGCRSGKSRYAEELAESFGSSLIYVATCPVVDEEMRQRIARHQAARKEAGWRTIEETTDLARVLGENTGRETLLVDCLTLWVNNILYHTETQAMDEKRIEEKCRILLDLCRLRPGAVIFVTNEVGLGIVPENALARLYRDLMGRCNQVIAAGADVVTLVTCGIPLQLKGSPHSS